MDIIRQRQDYSICRNVQQKQPDILLLRQVIVHILEKNADIKDHSGYGLSQWETTYVTYNVTSSLIG